MRTMLCHLILWILALGASAAAFAQAEQKPAFEVASVRLAAPGTRGSQRVTDARVDLVNIRLRELVLMAFRLDARRLSAPDWLNDVLVDVHATVPERATRADVPAMLQTLLAERFGLVAHVEPRPFDVYELTVGKNGPAMREVEPVDELTRTFPTDPSMKSKPLDSMLETTDGPIRMMMTPLGLRTVTARMLYERKYTPRRTTEIHATRMEMAELTRILTTNLDQPVIDRTGLAGLYQFTIELPPDIRIVRMMGAAGITTTVQGTPLTDPTGVSTFKAVEGLGLALEARRVPLDVVVVDRIERVPTGN